MCSSSSLKRVEEMTSIFFFMTLMRSTCLGKQNKATIGEFPEHNLITVSNKVKMPYSNLFPSPSGVTIGHFGDVPGRKYDPAALVLCAALSLPPGTLCVTARTSRHCSHSTRNIFLFQLAVAVFRVNKSPPVFCFFCRCGLGKSLCEGCLPLREYAVN